MAAGRLPKPIDQRHGHRRRTGLTVPRGGERRSVPRPPDGLLPSSRKHWRAYWLSDVARAADRKVDLPRIERWIGALDEYARVNAIFKQTRLVKGSTGQPALNPFANYLASLALELRAAENDLGLTPLARLRLGITYGQWRFTLEDLQRSLGQSTKGRRVEEWEAEWEQA